jgi:lipopolysaccharide/colanic/teichoic acid biosynthesis glycosyltransferase
MVFDRRETTILLLGDFFILAASLWVTLLIRNLAIPSFGYFEINFIPFLSVFLLSLVIFYISGLYEKQTRPIRRLMGVRIFGAQVATVALASILFFILPFSIAPKTILALYLVVSVVAVSMWRFYRMNRENTERNRVGAFLVGTGPAVLELYDEVKGNDWYLIRFISHIETAGMKEGGVFEAIAAGLDTGVQIIVLDTFDRAVMRDMAKCRALMANRVIVKDFASVYEEIFDRVSLDHLDTAPLFESLSKQHRLYDGAKRVFDVVLALSGTIVAVPLVIIAALSLIFESGMPFFRHERIGKDGRPFSILKLRSMLLNDHGDPELQKKNRVTAIGGFLRKTRIDELPQLWNVIKGDLSFIGPRPELPKIAEVYEREIPQYWMRHLITPGLSGWAQIHDYDAPRGPADVARTRRKLSFDLYYLKHRSFGLDITIAIKTIRALISFSGT